MANGGGLTIQNAADVRLIGQSFGFAAGNTLTVTGMGTSLIGENLTATEDLSGTPGSIVVEDSASVDLTAGTFGFTIGVNETNGHLTVRTGATATADDALLGQRGTESTALVTGNNSRWSLNFLNIGGNSSSRGGTGTLTVEHDGAVQVADQTKFWSSLSSITIDGGAFETNRLTNHATAVTETHTATVSISDPVGGTALTVGTHNGSSTFDGLIQDVASSAAGSLRKTGTGTFTLAGANTFTGTTEIDAGQIIVANANALQNSTVSINVDNGLDVNGFNATIGGLAGSGSLDVDALNITVGGNDDDTMYAGELSGDGGSLTKTGTGTLALTATNIHTGGTLLDRGTLSLGNDGALGAAGLTVLTVGPTIDYADTVSIDNAIELQGSVTLNVDTGLATQSGAISQSGGAASVEKAGPGTLILSGTNSYTDGTVISGGRLSISTDANLGGGSGEVSIIGNGALQVTSTHSTTRDFTIIGDGGTVVVDSGQTYTVNGIIGASGSLAKTGDGTLTLSGANIYQGGTTLDGGTLSLLNDSALGSGGLTVLGSTIDYADGIEIANPIELRNDVTLNVDSGGATQAAVIGEDSGSFGISKTGVGSLTLTRANTFTGTTSIDAGKIVVASSNALLLSTVVINVDGGLDVTTNATNNIRGLIANADLDLGARTLNVSATTTVNAGATIDIGAGTLNAQDDVTLNSGTINIAGGRLDTTADRGNGQPITLTGTAELNVSNGGVVDMNGANPPPPGNRGGSLFVSGGTFNLEAGSRLQSRGGTGPGTTGDPGAAGAMNLSGGVANLDGEVNLRGRDGGDGGSGGDVTVSGDHAGALNGTIDLRGGDGALRQDGGDGGQLEILGGSFTFDDSAAVLDTTPGEGGNEGGRDGSPGAVDVFSGTLILNAGLITGDSSVTPASADPITLHETDIIVTGGDVVATAAMTIDAGAEIRLSSGSVTATTLREVNGGNFRFTGGVLTVDEFEGALTQAGGTLAAGTSPGITHITGRYTLNAGDLEVEIAGLLQDTEHDFYDVTGNVNLNGGSLHVSLISPFALSNFQQFDIVNVGGTLSGTFAGLPQDALVGNFGGTDLFISYTAGNGNDIALYTIPEPTSLALLGLGGLTLMLRRA